MLRNMNWEGARQQAGQVTCALNGRNAGAATLRRRGCKGLVSFGGCWRIALQREPDFHDETMGCGVSQRHRAVMRVDNVVNDGQP
jgi:hypothetical protein